MLDMSGETSAGGAIFSYLFYKMRAKNRARGAPRELSSKDL